MTYVPNYSARRVYWSSQETVSDFPPTDTNTAGSMDLATDGVLMCGKATRGTTLLWTTTDVWTMTYIGGDFVYSFERIGNNCGVIGPRAAVVLDSGAYWMGAGKFFLFNGYVRALDCDVTDYVFGNFNSALSDSVWVLANPLFGEITWFYASAGSSEIDRYVTYSYQENHWSYGALSRTCGVTQQAGSPLFPVMIDASGNIYDHETGNSRVGAGTIFLESGPLQLGNGERIAQVQEIIPDDKTVGDVTATVYGSFYPDSAESSQSVSLSALTSVRLTGRQFRLRLQEALQTGWRVGIPRLAMVIGGRR